MCNAYRSDCVIIRIKLCGSRLQPFHCIRAKLIVSAIVIRFYAQNGYTNKKAVLSQGNSAMSRCSFRFKVCRQDSLQVQQ